MIKVFLQSTNQYFSNYLQAIFDGLDLDLSVIISKESAEDTQLVLVDTEHIGPDQIENPHDLPVILFAYAFKPLLVQYTNKLDINGVMTLEMDPQNISKCIRGAMNQDIFYDENMIAMLFSNSTNQVATKVASLTTREMEIVSMMMKDRSNEEIAQELDVSIRTINAHKGNIMRKLDTKTSCGLVKLLLEYSPTFKNQF